MNNAKMWLVVKPTVGVPLFLSAVAIGSFAVHVAVLTNTTWVADFLSGAKMGSSMAAVETEANMLPARATAGAEAPVYLDAAATTDDGLLVVLPDGRTARLVIEDDVALASSSILPQVETR
ncbi:MAG: light-harvesting protein [Rhodobacteraceae bacterium]|nr:light-harvesting protein [Paracoccaceae bacterium]